MAVGSEKKSGTQRRGVSTEMPVMNLGVTLLGIVYVGVLGSFGAAMLELSDRYGFEMIGTVIPGGESLANAITAEGSMATSRAKMVIKIKNLLFI